jgi:hypothetical protein
MGNSENEKRASIGVTEGIGEEKRGKEDTGEIGRKLKRTNGAKNGIGK